MRFSPSLLDEIKARLPVSQVVGRRVRLIKAGREWKGLSPFNAERTPSFFVNDQKQAWFDFSSGKNGNIFDFVMESEGLSFPEAVERLASEAGVALPARSSDAERQEKRRQGLTEVLEMACAHFEATLVGASGRVARDYLARRGLGDQARAEFRIGYAPAERQTLREHLAAKGVALEVMIEAGLLVSGSDIPVAYDRFRNRVMFPIQDGRGRVIAFGGRTLDPTVQAKYLNSPETALFHKGSLLFNQHRARKAAHDKGRVIAVEGYMDVIAMSAAGFQETVAPLGTALTEEQMGLLWRMADEPVLCFDGDKAGQRAAFRAVDLALSRLVPGKSVRFAFLPEGQDPDDLVRAEGAGAVEQVLDRARPLSEVLWMREATTGSLDTPERRAAMERRLREAVTRVADPVTRRYYEADIAERLRAVTSAAPRYGRDYRPRDGASGAARSGRRHEGRYRGYAAELPGENPALIPGPNLVSASTFQGIGSGAAKEALIVLALDARPDLLGELAEELAGLALKDADARALARALLDGHALGDERADNLGANPAASEQRELRERLRRKLRPGDGRFLLAEHDPAELHAALRQAISLHDRTRALASELREAEQALGAEPSEANLAWLSDVQARLQTLDHLPASSDGNEGGRTLEQAIAEVPLRKRQK